MRRNLVSSQESVATPQDSIQTSTPENRGREDRRAHGSGRSLESRTKSKKKRWRVEALTFSSYEGSPDASATPAMPGARKPLVSSLSIASGEVNEVTVKDLRSKLEYS